MRLRLRYTDWPVPAVALADTPRPGCCNCDGEGGYQSAGLGEEPENEICDCWEPDRRWRLLPVPRWIARRWHGWAEPPF